MFTTKYLKAWKSSAPAPPHCCSLSLRSFSVSWASNSNCMFTQSNKLQSKFLAKQSKWGGTLLGLFIKPTGFHEINQTISILTFPSLVCLSLWWSYGGKLQETCTAVSLQATSKWVSQSWSYFTSSSAATGQATSESVFLIDSSSDSARTLWEEREQF